MERKETYTFVDGHQVEYKRYLSPLSNPILMVIIPAMGVRASYYKRLARCMVEELAFEVITLDYRGMGKSSVRASWKNKIGYGKIFEDYSQFLTTQSQSGKYREIRICGHSMGGQIACMVAPQHSDLIKQFYIIGTCLPYYKTWPFRKRKPLLRLAGHLFYPIAKVVGHFPGDVFGFAGKEGMNTIRDWCHLVMKGKFEPGGSQVDFEKSIHEYGGIITAYSFTLDKMAPTKAVNILLTKFKKAHIHHHNIDRYDHFNWSKSPIVITQFIDQQGS